jgi:hypothetical protein
MRRAVQFLVNPLLTCNVEIAGTSCYFIEYERLSFRIYTGRKAKEESTRWHRPQWLTPCHTGRE